MKFSMCKVTKIISPQSIFVDEIPSHIKDLRLCHCVITPEEDSESTTSSEKRAESLLQDDGEDSELTVHPLKDQKQDLPSCLYKEVPDESASRQTASFVILRSEGSVAREIMHAAAQSMHEYVWRVK